MMRSFMEFLCLLVLVLTVPFSVASRPRNDFARAISSIISHGGSSPIPKRKKDQIQLAKREDDVSGKGPTSIIAPFVVGVEKNGRGNTVKKSSGWGLKPPNDRTGWKISLALSVMYTFFFFQRRETESCDVKKVGFCVTNLAECLAGNKRVGNSHRWAWQEDVAFTASTLMLPFILGIKPRELQGGLISWLGSAFIIIGHGAMHLFIANANCNPNYSHVGQTLYLGLTFFISCFAVGKYGDLSGIVPSPVLATIAISVAATVLTHFLTNGNTNIGISAIFLVTQLLASGTAVFIPKKGKGSLTPLAGYAFIGPCLISIIELCFSCVNGEPSMFNKTLGHAWYDLFLNITFIVALIPEDYFISQDTQRSRISNTPNFQLETVPDVYQKTNYDIDPIHLIHHGFKNPSNQTLRV